MGLRAADVADPLSAVADGLLVVSAVRAVAADPHQFHDVAVVIDREPAGCEASLSAGLIDSQSGQGTKREGAWLLRGQEGGRAQSVISRSTPMDAS